MGNEIKFKIILSVLAMSISTVAMADTYQDNVYYYEFGVKNAAVKRGDLDVPQKIARRLRRSGDLRSCIDLRTTDVFTTRDRNRAFKVIHSETVGFLSNRKIEDVFVKLLGQEVCRDAVRLGLKCKFKVKKGHLRMTDLKLVAKHRFPSRSGQTKIFNKSYRLIDTNLPKFSNACKSGTFSDSFSNTAATREAQQYLLKLGMDVSKTESLELRTINSNKVFWDFGSLSNKTRANQVSVRRVKPNGALGWKKRRRPASN